jgi:hypothetical protein
MVLPKAAHEAIKEACMMSLDLKVSYGECVLVLAGSAKSESTWNVDKSCEAWGMPWDPCCGLTQSRRSDARAVGLACDPAERSKSGYRCNALTGIRNLRCKADNGDTCDRFGAGRTLLVGIKKHLGGNQGALPSYLGGMAKTYRDESVRRSFGVKSVRGWEELLGK